MSDFSGRLDELGHHEAAESARAYEAARDYFDTSASHLKIDVEKRIGVDIYHCTIGKVLEVAMVVLMEDHKARCTVPESRTNDRGGEE